MNIHIIAILYNNSSCLRRSTWSNKIFRQYYTQIYTIVMMYMTYTCLGRPAESNKRPALFLMNVWGVPEGYQPVALHREGIHNVDHFIDRPITSQNVRDFAVNADASST